MGHVALVHPSDEMIGWDLSTNEPYRHLGRDIGVIVRLLTWDWALLWGRNIPSVRGVYGMLYDVYDVM